MTSGILQQPVPGAHVHTGPVAGAQEQTAQFSVLFVCTGNICRSPIGEALLRRAFAAYAAKGRTKAGLGVDMANPTRAARLYLAVGMKPLYEANIYQKTI